MAGLYDDAFIARLHAGVVSLLGEWALPATAQVTLLCISENATFVASDHDTGRRVVIRVHRPDYHTENEIAAELGWIQALREQAVVSTPAIIARQNGGHIARFVDGELKRFVVAFEFMSGSEPDTDDDLTAGFRQLGSINARLHRHALRWPRPAGFERKRWNFETTLGSSPHWGDWRHARGLMPAAQSIIQATVDTLERELQAYGETADRFGLIHADLRLANLLVDGERLNVIDFDDCGLGWFMYDIAAAISFIEEEPVVPDLIAAWLQGYREVAALSTDDEAAIPTFIMLRRILLTAWIASHWETPTAQACGEAFTAGTLRMAQRFLDSGSPLVS